MVRDRSDSGGKDDIRAAEQLLKELARLDKLKKEAEKAEREAEKARQQFIRTGKRAK